MKHKLLTALLGAALAFGGLSALAADNETAVWYNGKILSVNQPVLPMVSDVWNEETEDWEQEYYSSLLPFRSIAETTGATVTFDNTTSEITAKRGDRTANFNLYGYDEYTITDGEETQNELWIEKIYGEYTLTDDEETQSELWMEKAIHNDRVYTDAYALGDILGVQVDWDDSEQTIWIVDVPQYMEDLYASAPALKTYMEVFGTAPATYKNSITTQMQFDITEPDENDVPQVMNLDITLREENTVLEDVQKSAIQIDLETLNLPEIMAAEMEGVDLSQLQDIQIETIANADGTYYLQTNLIEKVAAMLPDLEELQTASRIVTDSTWMEMDLNTFMEETGMNELPFVNSADSTDVLEIVLEGLVSNSVYSLEDAQAIDIAFATYKILFSEPYFTMTGSEETGWEMTMQIDKAALLDIVKTLGTAYGFSEEEIDMELADMPLDLEINLTESKSPAGDTTTSGTIRLAVDSYGSGISMNFVFDGVLTTDVAGETIQIPASALDVLKIGELLDL